MKAAFCITVFKPDEIRAAVRYLKKIGYDGVEFWHQYIVKSGIEELKRLVDETDIEVAQICPYFNVTGTAEELHETFEIAEDYVEYAVKLNCELIRVFTGKVSSSEADDRIYRQGVEGLRKICDIGKRKGITFALETHEGSLMDTGPATLRLINDVERDNLKVNLQIPLGNGSEDIFKSAQLLGEHVAHLHAHNWIGGWPNLTYLNEGDYSFKKFVDILKNKGFDGYISIEHGDHMGKRDPYDVARHEIEYLKSEIL